MPAVKSISESQKRKLKKVGLERNKNIAFKMALKILGFYSSISKMVDLGYFCRKINGRCSGNFKKHPLFERHYLIGYLD